MVVEALVVEDHCRSGRSEPYKSNEVRIFVCIPIVELTLSRAKRHGWKTVQSIHQVAIN